MFEAYKVAVKISLVNQASMGLLALSKDFLKTEASASALQKRIHAIQAQAAKGTIMLGIGVAGLAAVKGPLDEAKKMQNEVTRFNSLGFGAHIDGQAELYARAMKTIGTSTTENMALVSDAMAVFKDLHHAEMAAPLLSKMKFANEAVFGAESGGANERKFMDMLKVIEFRGGLANEKEFQTQANFVQQVITGSRNRVDAGQLLSALKTGGVALSRRENEKFYLGSEPLIQEFGGQRYGTGAMSIYQNLVQARGTLTAQQELYRLGLLNKDMVQFNKLGQIKKAKAGAFVGSDILEREGELALLEKVLLPAFKKKGIAGEENIIRELGLILSNRTGSSLMGRIYQQRETISKQAAANKYADGIDQLHNRAKGTLAGKEIDLHAKYNNLMLALGQTVLPLAVKGLEHLIPMVKSATEWIDRNRTATKWLVGGFIALSGAMAIGGAINIAVAGLRGLGLAINLIGATRATAAVGLVADLGKAALPGLGTAIGALASPIGIAVLALGTLAAAAYAFRPMTQKEIDSYKDGGVGVRPNATTAARLASLSAVDKARMDALGSDFKPKRVNSTSLIARAQSAGLQSPLGAATPTLVAGSTVAPRPAERPLNVQTTVNLDGRKIGDIVSRYQAREASRPVGGTGFDTSRGLLAAGYGGGH
ncbi:hypothetical protein [Chitinimonas naiadis]